MSTNTQRDSGRYRVELVVELPAGAAKTDWGGAEEERGMPHSSAGKRGFRGLGTRRSHWLGIGAIGPIDLSSGTMDPRQWLQPVPSPWKDGGVPSRTRSRAPRWCTAQHFGFTD